MTALLQQLRAWGDGGFGPAAPYWQWAPPSREPMDAHRIGIGDRFALGILPARTEQTVQACGFAVVLYAYTGGLELVAGGRGLTLATGQTALLAAGTPHTVRCPDGGVTLSLVLAEPLLEGELRPLLAELSALAEVLVERRPPVQLVESQQSELVRWYLAELCREHLTPDRRTYGTMLPLLQMLLVSLDRFQQSPPPRRRRDGQAAVQEVLRYLRANFAAATLQATAERFGFSPNYLSHLLRQVTGKGFLEHKQDACIWQAAALLRQTDLPISQVAQTVGLHNTTHFYELFSARYGMTPGQYRSQREEGERGV